MRPPQVLLLCGALLASASALLTQEALRSSAVADANPIISRLSNFEVVRPVAEGSVFSALTDSEAAVTPSTVGYSLSAFGRSFKLQLSKNDALVSPSYQEMRIDFSTPEGKEVPHTTALPNCYYIGAVEHDDASVVALNLCGGLKGMIKTKDETYNIEPALKPSAPSSSIFSSLSAESALDHIIFRDSDIRSEEGEQAGSCGVVDSEEIANAIREEMSQAEVSETLPIADEFTIELLAFNDHARYRMKGESVEADTLQLANIAGAYYARTRFVRPLKMVLVGQVTFLNGDPFPVRQGASGVHVEGGNGLLWTFNQWRQTNRARLPAHDSGQLLSGLTFTSGIRGLAPVGAMCSSQSGSICQITSPSARLNAMIMAHETGHTMGMMHDTMGNSCPMGNIMQPSVSEVEVFSSCSIQYANQLLARNPQCLTNKVQVSASVTNAVRWDQEPIQMREPAAKRNARKAGEVIKQYWLAFLLGALFGGAMATSIGIIVHGLAVRRAQAAKEVLPTSVQMSHSQSAEDISTGRYPTIPRASAPSVASEAI